MSGRSRFLPARGGAEATNLRNLVSVGGGGGDGVMRWDGVDKESVVVPSVHVMRSYLGLSARVIRLKQWNLS